MAFTDIDICSRALVMIGAEPITSFTENTDEARACSNLYEQTVQSLLTSHPWRFCMGQEQVSRLSATPPDDDKWSAAYQLPSTCLHIRTVRVSGIPIPFDRYEDNIYCDAVAADEVYLDGHFRVDESFFPPYFTELLTLHIASLLAESIAAKTDLSNTLLDRSRFQRVVARNLDSQGRTASRIDTSRFTRVRFRNSHRNGDYYS